MKDLPIVQVRDTASIAPAAGAPARVQSNGEPSIAFQALIERLREQARTLEKSAEKPLNAGDLPGAVQAAQASLHDALSIADGLVEAYRSSVVQAKPRPPGSAR